MKKWFGLFLAIALILGAAPAHADNLGCFNASSAVQIWAQFTSSTGSATSPTSPTAKVFAPTDTTAASFTPTFAEIDASGSPGLTRGTFTLGSTPAAGIWTVQYKGTVGGNVLAGTDVFQVPCPAVTIATAGITPASFAIQGTITAISTTTITLSADVISAANQFAYQSQLQVYNSSTLALKAISCIVASTTAAGPADTVTTAEDISALIATTDAFDIIPNPACRNLRSTTAGNTLDVASTGEAGLDFSNIKDAGSAHTLTNITIPVITTATNLTNAPTAGDLTAAMKTSVENAVWDATASTHNTALTTGNKLNAAATAGDPWSTSLPGAYGAGTAGNILGNNLNATISSRQATVSFPTNFALLSIDGSGRMDLSKWLGSAPNALIAGRVDSNMQAAAAGVITSTVAPNLDAAVSSRQASGNVTVGGYAASQDPATYLLVTPANKIATNASNQVVASSVQGNVTGSVASVTGNVAGSVASVTGNVGGSVGSVAGNVTGSVGSLATQAKTDVENSVWDATASAHNTALSTGNKLSAAASAGDPWTASLPGSYGAGTAGNIIGNNINASITSRMPSGNVTVGSLATQAKTDVENSVWDAVASTHNTALSTGNKLSSAASAGDPWTASLPGAYGAGTAGNIVGNNLNAAISSRQATVSFPTNFSLLSIDGSGRMDLSKWLGSAPNALIAGRVDSNMQAAAAGVITSTVAPNLDAAVSSRQASGNVTIGGYATNQDPASLLLVTPANKIATNASNQVVASSVQGNVTGSVASVTGNVAGSVASVTGNVGGSVGSVAGNVTGSVGSLTTQAKTDVENSVWDATASAHNTALSTGNKLSTGGDPWATLVPGAYGAGTAGAILGNNLNASITSRQPTGNVTVGGYATNQDPGTFVLVTPANKIATNASNQVVASSVQGNVTGSVGSGTVALDFSQALPGSPAAGSVGEALKIAHDRLDLAVSTRASQASLDVKLPNNLTFTGPNVNAQVKALDPNTINTSVLGMPTGTVITAAAGCNSGINATNVFSTNRTETAANYWKPTQLLTMTSGALKDQSAQILGYLWTGSTGCMTVSPGFTSAPAIGDTFEIVNK